MADQPMICCLRCCWPRPNQRKRQNRRRRPDVKPAFRRGSYHLASCFVAKSPARVGKQSAGFRLTFGPGQSTDRWLMAPPPDRTRPVRDVAGVLAEAEETVLR